MKVGDLVCLTMHGSTHGSTVGVVVRDSHPNPQMGKSLRNRVGVRWLDDGSTMISYESPNWLRLLNERR